MAKRSKKKGGSASAARAAAIAKTKEKMSQEGRKGGSILNYDGDLFQPKKKHTFDIVPYTVETENHPEEIEVGETWWRFPYKMHANVGASNIRVLCPKTFGADKPCPICEEVVTLAEDYDSNKKQITAIKAKDRVLYNVLDHKDDVVKLWDVSYHLFGKLLKKEIEDADDEEIVAFWLPDAEGFSLQVRFEERNFNGRDFLDADRIDFLERDGDIEDVVEEANELGKLLPEPMSYEKLRDVFYGLDGIAPDDDEDEEVPPRRRKVRKKADEDEEEDESPRKRRSRKAKPEPEDDDEEEVPFPSEEEKPRKSRRRKPAPEPEDDEEEEEEEEAPAPRKRSRRSKPEPEPEDEDDDDDDDVGEDECPHGHDFGADCDETDDCEVCEVWEQCADYRDEMKAKEAPKRKRRKK